MKPFRRFSGDASRAWWDAIHRAEPDGPGILYDYGCDAQNMEGEVERLRREVERLKIENKLLQAVRRRRSTVSASGPY